MRKLIPLLLIVLLALSGCIGGNNNGTPPASTVKGTVKLSIDSDMGAKTFQPDFDMKIASYSIYGNGPNGASFNQSGITGNTANFELAVGNWDITVDAFNDDNQNIAMGIIKETVIQGPNTFRVTVTPLSGFGSLQLDMVWTANSIVKPVISSTLTAKSGDILPLPFNIGSDNSSASYENTEVATGYHILAVKLFDDMVLKWGALEAVRIIKNLTTKGHFEIINTGDVVFQIDPDLKNPIEIELNGAQDNIMAGTSMTITASTSEPVDTYQWYLNADPISGQTASSITIGSNLAIGSYRLDLLVSKGEVYSSASHTFRVTAHGPIATATPTVTPIPPIKPQDNNIAAGGYHSLALKNNGTVYAWGYNNYGQLGNGNKINSSIPILINNLTNVTAVAAGTHHSLALKSDGTVWAWGRNDYGQLGIGTTNNSSFPVQVTGLTNVVAIAAGAHHNVALKQDGTVWTWGYNNAGQLGIGTTLNNYIPVRVNLLANIKGIAASDHHSLAVNGDGNMFGWGENNTGELGIGSTTNWIAPVQLNGISNVKAIRAAGDHSLALKTDNTLWVWGDNSYGQLGNGTTNVQLTPIRVSSLSNVLAFTCGAGHTLAALSNGTVWSWGWNDYGQLGLGSNPNLYTPVPSGYITDVIMLSAGYGHSLAVKDDGTVWAWGYNNNGQLGDGTTSNKSTPIQISGLNLL
jgi:alpha-tubulin suppressor-like RCC1 family protein